ncbi:MAG: SDR family NAD(P)-dependent oxidoreductase [Oscillospiraceae bacterium]|jgi:NAD(P)-dependent dehydrogenase (short-subunit alcohol dehydrogenase family)
MKKVAVVTGGSSGIGRCTADLLSQNGYAVYELSRHGASRPGVVHITADIGDKAQVERAMEQVFRLSGRLDVLVNNAGFGISGPVEFTDPLEVRHLFDVNFFGALHCIQCAVPYLRQTGGGHIVNLSSVAAPLAIPFQAFYSCVKAAVNGLTLALANELRPFHIAVSAVMPGDAKTGFTAARRKETKGREVYGEAMVRAVQAMERDEETGMSPSVVARCILRIVSKPSPKPFYVAGAKYKLFVGLARLLPARFVNYVVGKLYG